MTSMTSALEIILPIFALILAGFFYRRTNRLGAAAASELNRFVVYLALPALLFDIMSRATWSELYLPGFVATFSLGCGVIYALTVIVRLRVSHNLADASIDGLGAAYANTGYIGFPLCLLLFGKESLPAVTVAAIVTTCVLFAVAIVLIEIGLHAEQRLDRLIINVGAALACNPLLVSPVLGVAFGASGLGMPQGIQTFLTLLGSAASPSALVALGVFLAEKRPSEERDSQTTILLAVGKLFLQPALTWVLAYHVFFLSPKLANTAVLLAALPTGTGPFMLAELYQRGTIATSNAILYSTIGAVITLSLLLFFSGYGTH